MFRGDDDDGGILNVSEQEQLAQLDGYKGMRGFRGFGAVYSYTTTAVFTPKAGLFSTLFGARYSQYERGQIDYWMRVVGAGTFDVLSVKENADHSVTYTVGSSNQELTESALKRILPNVEKYSSLDYNTRQAVKEAAGVVGQAGASLIETAGGAVTGLATPILKSALPYLLAGVVIVGGVLYVYGKGARKVRAYVSGR